MTSTVSTMTVLFFFGAIIASSMAKPVSNKKVRATTTPPPAPEDDGIDSLINSGLLSLGNGVSCDGWIESKMKSMNTNVDELAKMIVEAEPKELALEFIVFCLMDDQPMSDRPNMLKSAIDEEKVAMTATTTPKPAPVKARSKNSRKV